MPWPCLWWWAACAYVLRTAGDVALAASYSPRDVTRCDRPCSRPVPRVYPIRDVIGDAARDYEAIGRAYGDLSGYMVVLRRCTADVGCCNKDGQACAPITGLNTNITIKFWGRKKSKSGPGRHGIYNETVEVHTQCECQQKTNAAIIQCQNASTIKRS